MSRYIRAYVPGGTFFFTVALLDRKRTEGDADFSTRWFLIKREFLRHVPRGEALSERRLQKGERGIWQRRFWEHTIRSESDFAAHVDYIHYNPVKHGHVERVADWPHSSFHRYVAKGMLPADWAAGPETKAVDYE